MWEWRPTRLAILRRMVLSFLGACLALAITAGVVPGLRSTGPRRCCWQACSCWPSTASSAVVLHWLLVGLPIFVAQALGLVVQFAASSSWDGLPGVDVGDAATAVWGAVLLTMLNSLFAELVAVSDDDSYYSVLVRRLVARDFRQPDRTEPGVARRPDRRAEPARPEPGDAGRASAGARPAGARRRGDAPSLDRDAAAHDAGQPGGHPARPQRRHRRLSLVREGERQADGGQPPGGRGRDRPPHQRRRGPAGRGRGQHRQPRDRRRAAQLPDDGDDRRAAPADDARRLRGFFVTTVNYVRLLVLMVGEMAKELYQAERQRGRSVEPRMHRDLHFAVERAVTNIALRTVSTALVIEEMYGGAPTIYVDYTGYDAIAHHCGPERQEAIDALEGIDRAIGSLLKAARHTGRAYRLVVLSDHGQCLGATFRQRYGQSLEGSSPRCCRPTMSVVGTTDSVESAGMGRRIAAEFGRGSGLGPLLARRLPSGLRPAGAARAGARPRRRRTSWWPRPAAWPTSTSRAGPTG